MGAMLCNRLGSMGVSVSAQTRTDPSCLMACIAAWLLFDQGSCLMISQTPWFAQERNTEDLFFLDLPYMGDVIEIDIGHDNSGIGPGALARPPTHQKAWLACCRAKEASCPTCHCSRT